MDQKKQFLILLGALILIIILIIVVPGPNFGQISLLGNDTQTAQENILEDSTLTLSQDIWSISTSDFTNTVDPSGLHTLQTSPTGLILTQTIAQGDLTSIQNLRVEGSLISTSERDTFFITILDSNSDELLRETISPLETFSFDTAFSEEERTRLRQGDIKVRIELPGSAEYSVGQIAVRPY